MGEEKENTYGFQIKICSLFKVLNSMKFISDFLQYGDKQKLERYFLLNLLREWDRSGMNLSLCAE